MLNQYDFRILKTLRRKHNLTLHALANACGLTYATVAGIETNKSCPSLRTIDALARQFNLPASQLLALCEKPDMIHKTAETMHIPADTKDIIGMDRCKKVKYGDIQLIHVCAAAGDIVQNALSHPDVFEICYVLSGSTRLICKSSEKILAGGESTFFDGGQKHRYQQIETGEFLVAHIPKTSDPLTTLLPKIA